MSPQMMFLANVLSNAEKGDLQSVALLRLICIESIKSDLIPTEDLVRLGRCLHEIGVDAWRRELSKN